MQTSVHMIFSLDKGKILYPMMITSHFYEIQLVFFILILFLSLYLMSFLSINSNSIFQISAAIDDTGYGGGKRSWSGSYHGVGKCSITENTRQPMLCAPSLKYQIGYPDKMICHISSNNIMTHHLGI